MNIVVCIKQVPDTSEVKIDPKTNNLVREGIPSIINPFDLNGIEAALRLREIHGGRVTVLSMGPPQAARVLQYALDMGADEAVLVNDRALAGSDTLATGYALATIIRKLPYDLIICGLEAIDGCTGQVGPIIAENLDIPQFTYIRKLGIEQGNKIVVSREVRDGYELLQASLPVVVCVAKDINEPREAQPSSKTVIVWNAADAGLVAGRIGINGSPTRVAAIKMSDVRAKSYVTIDSSLSAEERIKAIIQGGLADHKKNSLQRGTAVKLAALILNDPGFQKYLEV